MTLITDSFETLVETALFERLETLMGDGGTYSDPHFLQIKTFTRSLGEVIPQLPEQDMPFVWLDYVGGVDRGPMIGSPVGSAREVFMLYGYMILTPEILQLPTADVGDFVQAAKANAGTWARRLRKSLLGWSPSVSCPVTGQKVSAGRPTAYGLSATYINDLRREFTVTIRWELELEP